MKRVTVHYLDHGIKQRKSFSTEEATEKGISKIVNIHKATKQIQFVGFAGSFSLLVPFINQLSEVTI